MFFCSEFFRGLILLAAFSFFLPAGLSAQRKANELRTKLYYEFENIPFLQPPDSIMAYLMRDPRHYQATVGKREGNTPCEFEVRVNTDRRKRYLSNEPSFIYLKDAKHKVIDSVQKFSSIVSIVRNYHKERFAKSDFLAFRQEFKKHFSRRKRPFIKEMNFGGNTQSIYFYCSKRDRFPYLELALATNEGKRTYTVTLTVMK